MLLALNRLKCLFEYAINEGFMALSTVLKDAKQLGKIIRDARKRQKVSQIELADFTGLHRNGIAKIEAGTVDVKLGTLLRIASLLRLTVLLEDIDE